MEKTPNANRLHIGIFGRTNAGKSTVLNAITGQEVSLVSKISGTTTDPVYKPMELHPIGPCVFIDTAGMDDDGVLGEKRIEKTKSVIDKTDLALLVFSGDEISHEKKWAELLKENNVPTVFVLNKIDQNPDYKKTAEKIEEIFGKYPVLISGKEKRNIQTLINEIAKNVPDDFEKESITADLVKEDDVVLLVMPQEIQAPKGRLILPQVQTIRDLLDNKCVVCSTTTDKFHVAVNSLKKEPDLIITDSQVFDFVYKNKPKNSRLTSFSVLFASYKGDAKEYVRGAEFVDTLKENSKILIAESCSHKPLKEDIGRVKIPAMLKKRFGEKLTIDIKAGNDFPEDLTGYDLVIQCGGCMFNRKHILSRIEKAKKQNVPITNYGIFIAKMNNILDKIDIV
ncbi:MAG: [Clostridia bacterium]|nr:[FeFe] hydrogenase H-cluster maturation GTPase HydF [Clostridia bacterium]